MGKSTNHPATTTPGNPSSTLGWAVAMSEEAELLEDDAEDEEQTQWAAVRTEDEEESEWAPELDEDAAPLVQARLEGGVDHVDAS
ncbi:MAG: hypothetical protein U5Q44_03110 [Dehalococcoidia bacterium]|nr:hypothetical protein [Dehalococcoidia bacterium]